MDAAEVATKLRHSLKLAAEYAGKATVALEIAITAATEADPARDIQGLNAFHDEQKRMADSLERLAKSFRL